MFVFLRKAALCVAVAALSVSCEKDVIHDPMMKTYDLRVLIGNEGQFGYGTASLTGVTVSGEVINDIFRTVNERPIGDVVQSITNIGDNFYVTLNNSRKIEVFNNKTFVSVETMPTPEKTIPTYVVDLGNKKIAVSEKGSNRLMIMDIDHSNPARNIAVNTISNVGSANQMIIAEGKLFLAGGSLRVIDVNKLATTTDVAVDMRKPLDGEGKTISVVGDSKIIKDKEGKLWVLNAKKLLRIDPATEAVIGEYPFSGISIDTWGGRLDISPDGERLYFTGKVAGIGGVLRMNIADKTVPTTLLFPHTGVRTLYNMSVSPDETVFICDVQYGSLERCPVHEYTTNGVKIKSYTAGIFAQYIYFYPKSSR